MLGRLNVENEVTMGIGSGDERAVRLTGSAAPLSLRSREGGGTVIYADIEQLLPFGERTTKSPDSPESRETHGPAT